MKNLVIIQQLPHGARFAQLTNNFKLDIDITNDVVFLDFIDEPTNELLFGTFFFIDYDDGYKSFDDFSEKGQELLLERLTEAIASDIATFMGGKYENVAEPGEPYHEIGGCFDIDGYMDNWLEYYNLISDDEDILDEYTDPEEKGDEEQ